MLVLCALLAACEGDAARSADDGAEAAAVTQAATERRFTSPAGFALPFSTTVNPPLEATTEPIGERAEGAGAVRFAPPGDSGDTFLRVVVLRPEMGRNDALGLARAISADFGPIGSGGLEYRESIPAPAHAWAIESFGLRGVVRGQAVEGWLSLGEHAGRHFYIMSIAPDVADPVLNAAFAAVLDEWTWLDGDTAVPLRAIATPTVEVPPVEAAPLAP